MGRTLILFYFWVYFVIVVVGGGGGILLLGVFLSPSFGAYCYASAIFDVLLFSYHLLGSVPLPGFSYCLENVYLFCLKQKLAIELPGIDTPVRLFWTDT